MPEKKILLSNNYSQGPLSVVQQELPEGFRLESLVQSSKEELLTKISNADYLLVSGRLAIDRDVIAAAKKLKMIQRTGVGMDNMDVAPIRERGIPIYVNFGVNADSVAEHTILLMLAATRNLANVDRMVKSGIWKKNEIGLQNRDLSDLRIGLIGLGNIGQKVCRILQSFGSRVYYYDTFRQDASVESDLNVSYSDLQSIVSKSDILSLHCSLNENTRWMLAEQELSSMKPGSIIINTARGPLINEEALINCLQKGPVSFACLDVFEREPPSRDNVLLNMPNVILTPHIGGLTSTSFKRMIANAMKNIKEFERGNYDAISNSLLR